MRAFLELAYQRVYDGMLANADVTGRGFIHSGTTRATPFASTPAAMVVLTDDDIEAALEVIERSGGAITYGNGKQRYYQLLELDWQPWARNHPSSIPPPPLPAYKITYKPVALKLDRPLSPEAKRIIDQTIKRSSILAGKRRVIPTLKLPSRQNLELLLAPELLAAWRGYVTMLSLRRRKGQVTEAALCSRLIWLLDHQRQTKLTDKELTEGLRRATLTDGERIEIVITKAKAYRKASRRSAQEASDE